MRRAILAVIALGGCDRVFELEALPVLPDAPDAIVTYDRCAPIAHDGLRYAAISGALSWDDARAACMRRGMDLAVVNDATELGSLEVEARPVWLGAAFDGTAWRSTDGCPAFQMTTQTPGATQCGYAGEDPAMILGGSCDGVLDAERTVNTALCETPRAAHGNCGLVAPEDETYELSEEAMSYAMARTYCAERGGHLLVIDTHAELTFFAKLASDRALPRVWIGATFDLRTWKSDTTCPGLYSWTTSAPKLGTSTDCVATTMVTPEVPDEDQAEPRARLEGMTPVRCNAEDIRALCELNDSL